MDNIKSLTQYVKPASAILLFSYLCACSEYASDSFDYRPSCYSDSQELYRQREADWDRFDQEQAIQRAQWQEQRHFNEEQFQRNMDRLGAGLP